MKRDWLWDRKVSTPQAMSILSDPKNKRFVQLAALLLSRKNNPKEVFQLLSKKDFCVYWAHIKKKMRKDAWNLPRITFWQAIFEKTKDKLEKKGEIFKPGPRLRAEPVLAQVGKKIRDIRKSKGLTQKELAIRLNVSQQLVSRIEQGRENVSLLILNRISSSLGIKLGIDLQLPASP